MNKACRSCGIRLNRHVRLGKRCQGCAEIEAETFLEEFEALRVELILESLQPSRDKNGKE